MLPACRQTAIPACGVKEWGHDTDAARRRDCSYCHGCFICGRNHHAHRGICDTSSVHGSPLADDDDNDDLSDDTATLLSMLPGASVVVDEHDEVVRCNPAAYRLGVVSDDAIAQQHVLDAIHEARKSPPPPVASASST